MTVAITRHDLSAAELRRRACGAHDSDQARRLLAIAMVRDGAAREAAAKAAGMTRQTLRDWVIRYNAEGVDGLVNRTRPGRPPRLKEKHIEELDRLVEKGPEAAVDGVVRWRCVDLKGLIKERFGADLSERSVARILRQRRFTRLSVRPRHPKADAAAQEALKKTLPHW